MSERERSLPDCKAVRAELPSLLYDELEPGPRASLERHLAGCADCRAEHRTLTESVALLDAWPAGAGEARVEDAGALVAAVRARAAGRRRRSSLHRLVPLAAALLVVLGLYALGARASYEAGRLTVGFGSFESRDEEPGPEFADLEPALRGLVRSELGDHLGEWAARRDTELAALVAAIEHARSEDRQLLEQVLATFTRGSAREQKRTRDALVDLASYVASIEPAPSPLENR